MNHRGAQRGPSRGIPAFQREQARALLLVLLGCAVLSGPYLLKELWGLEVSVVAPGTTGAGPSPLGGQLALPHLLFNFPAALWGRACLSLDLPLFFLRLPSWICSMAAVGFLFAFVQRCRGLRAASCGASILAASHVFLSVSCQVQGYSLSMLCTAAALYLAVRFLESRTWLAFCGLVLALAAGASVISTNWPIFLAIAFWAVCEGWEREQPGCSSLLQGVLALAAPLLGPLLYLAAPGTRHSYLHSIEHALERAGQAGPILKEWCGAVIVDLVLFSPLVLAGYFLMLREKKSGDREDAKSLSWQLTFSLVPLLAAFKVASATAFLPLLPWWCAILGMLMDDGCWAIGQKKPAVRPFIRFLVPVILLLGLFREAQFPGQYRRRFEGDRPASLYYQYYHVDFSPSSVSEFLAGAGGPQAAAFINPEDDPGALMFYAARSGFRGIYRIGTAKALQAAHDALQAASPIYIIARNEELAARQLNLATMGRAAPDRLTEVLNSGYYKVFKLGP